jgi:ABC-2 type transport system ATP-binding protein
MTDRFPEASAKPAAIEVQHLTKSYGPRDLTFTVPRGAICGFLGPNGAGKTTTMRILMGLARSRSGTAAMLGVPAGSTHEIFTRVAFVPEIKDLYPYARVDAMIRMTRGFFPRWDHELERHLLDRFELPPRQRCNKLSKGMRSKLALLLAVCRRCELLVLDEPTDGLDPLGIEDTLRLLVEQAGEHGTTIFFSSHQLSDIEQIADHIVIIRRGQCVVDGAIDDVRQRWRRVRCVMEAADAALPPIAAGWRREGRVLSGFSPHDATELDARLAGTGIRVMDSEPATIKEIFFDQVKAS